MKFNLKQHNLGYYYIHPAPNEIELQKYYSEKYYQESTVSTYSKKYTEEELKCLKIDAQLTEYIVKNHSELKTKKLLDIACGEGFFMQNILELDWEVLGTDYSSAGIENHNSTLINKVLIGKLEDILIGLEESNQQFTLLNLGNILEHVLDPIKLLIKCKNLLFEGGILRVKVPNDFSELQLLLNEKGLTNSEWVHPPDHLSYFNFKSLRNLVNSLGFEVIVELGDFPIELYLLNKNSNYFMSADGKEAHNARIIVSNLVWNQGIENYLKWSEGLSSSNLSRSCIFYLRKNRITSLEE
jgi:2-polyprenyl-3-methyl-5-hydroxy-6-metoxy-1,4-benzoquinol methylase